ncbi:MAG: protein kinase domain-containing protein, partial [Bryobacteraceae bacterium]
VETIYHAALEHTPEQRAGFIAQACSSDSGLRREVESLLAYHGRGDALLEAKGVQRVIGAMIAINIEPGASLGPYQILAKAGKGGMGEVYKACDVRLNRVVAIKVLPYQFGIGLERRSRIERESKAISSLNHPHICALFDIGEQNSLEYMVMEYLEGETLADRLKGGALPLEEAQRLAIQILEALKHAHRRAIVHRDLKPANVMLTANGVKLLDFGLAKMLDRGSQPTGESSVSAPGAIIGTLQYMAPEQLEGNAADERADIYAFGAVLYEMLTGHRAFEGETQAALISAIMTKQPPPLHVVQPSLPGGLEHVVENCLAKDAEARWQTAADVMLELKWLSGAGSYAPSSVPEEHGSHRAVLLWVAVLIVVVATLSFLGGRFGTTKVAKGEAHPVRLEIPLPEEVAMEKLDSFAISPDGRKLVFAGQNTDGRDLLWVRDLDSLQPHALPDVEGQSPFWFPDSRSIGFISDTKKLQRVNAAGGTPVTLCDAADANMGTFSANGRILFASNGVTGELRSVPELGGKASVVLRPDKSKGARSLNCPSFLPDGRHFLYFSRNMDGSKMGIYAATIDSGKPNFVMPAASCALYAPPGYILFIRDDALIAQPFDPATLQLHGNPFTLAEDFGSWDAQHERYFSVSQTGVLAYRGNDAPQTQLMWYSRDGKRLETAGENGRYLQIALSPDGTKVTLERLDTTSNVWNLWLLDLRTGTSSRLTSDSGVVTDAVWSPDSRELVFGSDRIGQMDLFRKAIGAAKDWLLYADGEKKVPESWTRTGDIVYMTGLKDIYLLKADGSGKPVPLLKTGFQKDEPHVSPDGRWIAYGSVESGPWDIYVASFPDFENKRQISNGGGAQALWRADGKELYYLTLDGKMMAVEIMAGTTLKTGVPKFLFETRLRRPKPVLDQYGVSPDGQKFLVAEPLHQVAKPITVVLDWQSAMQPKSDH